jgi:hypothetical protein
MVRPFEAVRNAKLGYCPRQAVETAIGVSPVLKIRTGAPPANCAAADTGTVLATCTLPSDWMAAASAGTKAKSGTWEDTSADAAAPPGITGSMPRTAPPAMNRARCATGGGGDLTVDNVVFAVAQQFTVTGYTKTAGNA